MLVVKTKLKEIEGKGIGLIADQVIRSGQSVYKEDPNFRSIFISKEVDAMPSLQKEFIATYAIRYKTEIGYIYYLDMDNTRFINHSHEPNISKRGTAIKDIQIGEELTCNYLELSIAESEGGLDFEVK